MVDLSQYERLGDLDAPFEISTKQNCMQSERDQWREARCVVPPISYEEFAAGVPCPGCGRPYIDSEPWEFRGTMHFTPDERIRYDAEENHYQSRHKACRSHRHSVAGSLTTHCGKCCPAPPFSPARLAEIGKTIRNWKPKEPHELMRWQLRLFCGHVIERKAHYSQKTLHNAFTGSVSCTECGLDPAVIIDAAAIGLAGTPPKGSPPTPRASRPTRVELEQRVRELEAEVDRLQATHNSEES